nr:hypothetical protein [uncultured Flavobacterium sp.]
MKKNIFKYMVFVVFALLQVQLYAYITKTDDLNLFSKVKKVTETNFFVQDPELMLNFDNVIWGLGNYTSVNVIANDKYIDDQGVEHAIILGANGNATIEIFGTWPSGFSLDTATGVISTTATEKPDMPLQYTVCVGGICKINSLTYQNETDVLIVTKTDDSTSTLKNGEEYTYVVTIENKAIAPVSTDFEEILKVNEITQTATQASFVSWALAEGATPMPSTLLTVNQNNELNGSFTIPGTKSVTITIKIKLNAVLTSPLKTVSKATALNGSENVFANNTASADLNLQLFQSDLAVTSQIENPYSIANNNMITVRVTNVGTHTLTSTGNNIKVKVSIDGSENLNNVVSGDFTVDNPPLELIVKREFVLNNGISLAPGEYREFRFSKNGLSTSGGQVYTHNFTLNYAADQNSINNTSTVSQRNSPNPGKITFVDEQQTTQTYTCNEGIVFVRNFEAASSTVTLANIDYKYQISNDGGLTWETLKNGSRIATGVYDLALDPNLSSNSNPMSDAVFQNTNTIELRNITSDFLIRRYVYNAGQTELFSWTPSLEVNVIKNEIIFDNDTNSFSLPLGDPFTLPIVNTTYKSAVKYYSVDPLSGNSSEILDPTVAMNLPEGFHEFIVEVTTVNTGGNNTLQIAPALGCVTSSVIKVLVYDPADCVFYTKRNFATKAIPWSSGLSGVTNPNQAVPSNPNDPSTLNRANAATLTGGVVLLGIGTVGIDLYFTKPNGSLYSGAELRGKKIVLKLGEQYSGLKVAGGLTVIGRFTNAPTPGDIGLTSGIPIGRVNKNVGKTFGVKGGVLDALKGDNVFEFSFTPANTNGSLVDFNGVRIQLGSLIGVADLGSVFYAYIAEEGEIVADGVSTSNTNNINQTDYCALIENQIKVSPPSSLQYPTNQRDVDGSYVKQDSDPLIENENIKLNPFVEDAIWGNYSEVLNVASSLSSVVFPYYSVDNDYDSYTLFNATAGVLNKQFLQAKLKQRARPGDQVQITLAYPNINVLNLSLLQLGNFKIVYYLNGAKVGEEKLEKFRVLDLGLFRFNNKRRAVLSRPVNFMFDAVELQQFNTVSVNLGDGLHVHDIRINPLKSFVGMTDPKEVTKLCATESLLIQKPDACTSYQVSFARVTEYGGTYQNADGSPMLDYNGKPIKMIKAIEDIANSNLALIPSNTQANIEAFDLNLTKLFVGEAFDNKMLIKITTKRQGCLYGEPQYLRVNIVNCEESVVNPVLKSNANY